MVMGFELWQGRPIDGALGCQIPVQVDKHSAIASEMVQKDLDDKERKPCPNAAYRRNPLITSHDCHSKIDWCQTASSFIEQERILCHELESMVTLSSRSEAKSIEPVADDNIVEINPLRISPSNARDSAVLNDVTSTNCFHRLHTDYDSDLGYEQLEAYPEVTSEASTEAATYVKVFLASGSDANQTNAGTFEAPLTTNIPNSHSFHATSEDSLPAAMRRMHITTPVGVPLTINIPNSHSFHATSEDSLPAAMLRMNITTHVSEQKQPMPIVTVLEGMDGSGSQIGNNQGSNFVKNKSKRKRKPRSEGDDMHLKAAVQKFGEGNWGYIVKGESMMGDRTAAQLSQRWGIITRKKSNTNLKLVTKANGSLLSEVQRAALHAINMALDPSPRNTFVNNSIGVGQAFGSATAVRRLSLRRSLVEPKQVPTQKHNLVGRGNKMSSCGSEAAGEAKVQLGGSHGEQVKKDDKTDPGHKKPSLNGEMLISQNPCHLVQKKESDLDGKVDPSRNHGP